MASTAMRPDAPDVVTIAGMVGFKLRTRGGSNLDVQNLTTAIHSILRVHAVRTKRGTIRRIPRELGSLKGIGRAAVGAAAFGLLAFRIGHERGAYLCAGSR